MTILIQEIANWLTSCHSITMMGWKWLIAAPLVLFLLLLVGGFLGAVVYFGGVRVWR